MMQLYTFLETTLVTAALLPQFIVFLSDADVEVVHPGILATIFLAFGLHSESS
jgi:palmitoyltransferase